jgi:hypothetical protein
VRGERRRSGTSQRGRWALACASVVALLATAAATATDPDTTTWTLVGTGALADSGDGGHAREAAINQPRAVSALPDGGYAWAEPYAHRVRIVDPNGVVSTLAGTGEAGFAGDGGKATAAKLNFVHTAVPTADGGFLLADTWNSRIRKISSLGIITTVAGTGVHGFGGDGGPATRAQIYHPRSVAPLADGGFLFPDSNNHRVRKVSASGTITTVAGTGAVGFSGDGGPATEARLSVPFAVAPTADGGFLIADIDNERIRKVSAAGIITTVAGNGMSGFSGDGGPATSASLHHPHNVLSLPEGGFLIADTTNERVRRVDADGIISTVIGDGVRGDSGDGGPAASARVSAPKAISLTERGDLLIADEQNNRIRFVGTVVIPTNVSPPAISGDALEGRQLLASSGLWHGTGPQLSYQWQRCRTVCENIPGAGDKRYTPGAADAGGALRVTVTASNPAGERTAASVRTSTLREPSGSRPSLPPAAGASTPPGKTAPGVAPPRPTNWLVLASMTFQRAQEYIVRTRNTRLSDAITAYGRPSCKVITAKHVVATWVERGIRIDSLSNRALPSGKTGCSSPRLIYVSEIRLTDRRWVTSLGLRVGDTIARLRRLYPRSPYVRTQRNEYYLVWRHARCTSSCTPQTRRRGVNYPRLSAQVANGRVVALWLPVLGQRR